MSGTLPHSDSWALLAVLRAHGFVVRDDEWLGELLATVFGAAAPDAHGPAKLLFEMRAGLWEHRDPFVARVGRRLMHWAGDSFTWFSTFNAALAAEPLRVMRTEISNGPYEANIGAYVIRGATAAERLLTLAGPSAWAADHDAPVPDPDPKNSFTGEPNIDGEDGGYETLYDIEALLDLARRIDEELEACGSPDCVYYLGAWGEGGRDSRQDLMLLSTPAFIEALAELRYRIPRVTECKRSDVLIAWDPDALWPP